MATPPALIARDLRLERRAGRFGKYVTFRVQADLSFSAPGVVGVLGPNGSGKTTLLDLISGSETPTSGEIICDGWNIHRVRPMERMRLVNHRSQRHHTRGQTGTFWNAFRSPTTREWLDKVRFPRSVGRKAPAVHLFDEPDLNDGLLGLLLQFIENLKVKGNLVLIAFHPEETMHLRVLRKLCDSFVFMDEGTATPIPSFEDLIAHEQAQLYLDELLTSLAEDQREDAEALA